MPLKCLFNTLKKVNITYALWLKFLQIDTSISGRHKRVVSSSSSNTQIGRLNVWTVLPNVYKLSFYHNTWDSHVSLQGELSIPEECEAMLYDFSTVILSVTTHACNELWGILFLGYISGWFYRGCWSNPPQILGM